MKIVRKRKRNRNRKKVNNLIHRRKVRDLKRIKSKNKQNKVNKCLRI